MEDSGVTRRTVLRGTALGVLGAAALPAADAFREAASAATASLTLTVDTASPGHAVSSQLYGTFFEEINYAGVGSLYAELIRNRAFMDPATPDEFVTPANIPRVPGKFGSALRLNGGSPAVRHHRERQRQRAAARRAQSASAEHLDAPRRHPVRHHRHAVRERHGRGHQHEHDPQPVQPA